MRQLKALGTDVTISGAGEARAAERLMELAVLLTRFAPSALTALNTAGHLEHPPADLVQALTHALRVARETGGLVTPAVLPALEAAGYAACPGQRRGAATAVPTVDGVECSAERIALPGGVRLDLGGTAKSWIALELLACLEGDAYVDAGGDVALRQIRACSVGIEHPFGGPSRYLNLPAGEWGVATSSRLKRAWADGHHLIDPRTARPLSSRFVQTTAVTGRVTDAEVLTKLAFLDAQTLDTLLGSAQVYAYDGAGQLWQRHHGAWRGV